MSRRVQLLLVLAVAAVSAAQPVPERPREPRPRHFTFVASTDIPLSYDGETAGELTQGEESVRSPRLALSLRYSPREPWFARVDLFRYLDRSKQAPWHPDFVYSFGYDDWRSNTIAVTYDNYGGNRFDPDRSRNEAVTRVEEGRISIVYKIPVSRTVEAIFNPHPDDRLSASTGLHLTPRFHRSDSPERGEWKQVISAGVRNRFYLHWYGEARVYYYPREAQQQPWDPDFTYGFGYADWRPGTVSIQYGNYAANRFGAGSRARGARFRDGALTVSWQTSW